MDAEALFSVVVGYRGGRAIFKEQILQGKFHLPITLAYLVYTPCLAKKRGKKRGGEGVNSGGIDTALT